MAEYGIVLIAVVDKWLEEHKGQKGLFLESPLPSKRKDIPLREYSDYVISVAVMSESETMHKRVFHFVEQKIKEIEEDRDFIGASPNEIMQQITKWGFAWGYCVKQLKKEEMELNNPAVEDYSVYVVSDSDDFLLPSINHYLSMKIKEQKQELERKERKDKLIN